MAHFMGWLVGKDKPISRIGTPNSGVEVEAKGWNSGVIVKGETVIVEGLPDGLADDKGRVDVFTITFTGGSHGETLPEEVGQFYRLADGDYQFDFRSGDSLTVSPHK